ncbi:hypothetical protein Aperf_G00000099435 [Anoplocephala perfoliata]
MILNSIGIIATIGVIVTLALYSETPIVRATGRELTYLLLSGCLLCYFSSLMLLVPPSPAACAIQRIGIGLGFAIMYASLLTKTNRLARIFDAAKRTTKRPAFISPRSQLAIAGILIGLQFVLTAIWLGFDPPSTRVDQLQSNFLVLRCAIKDSSMVTSLAYIMLLIVVCTIYAVKTRSIPENFNESRFIGFAMYTTCIIWLAFVPIYFATMNNFEIQISTLSVSVSLSATVTLVCLFAPKVYIIYFHPEKNIRKLTMNSGPGGRSRYATCKSPQESYARQNSSMATDCVITNAMVTQSTQPSSTLKATSDVQDSRTEQELDDMMEVAKRPLLTPPKESATVNVLIPRRDSKTFAEPIVVAHYQPIPNSPLEDEITLGVTKPPAYQALISPMPLLLDNLAVGITSVPACLCEEEEEIQDDASLEGTDISDAVFGNERCYSSRPTPSELSINAPDCREDDTNSANLYVYHNQASQLFDSPPSVQNGRVSSGTDSIGELWQQVRPLALGDGRIRSGTGSDQNQRYTSPANMPYNIVSVSKNRLDEEKISSV